MKCRFVVAALALASAANGYAFCFAEAANRYGVNEQLLVAIAKVESGFNPNARHVNSNKTTDIGLMQINSSHLPELIQYQITEKSLLNPCTNVHVGAWVLAQSIRHYGSNWRAVGAYNGGLRADREAVRQIYARKVVRALHQASAAALDNSLTPTFSHPVMQVTN